MHKFTKLRLRIQNPVFKYTFLNDIIFHRGEGALLSKRAKFWPAPPPKQVSLHTFWWNLAALVSYTGHTPVVLKTQGVLLFSLRSLHKWQSRKHFTVFWQLQNGLLTITQEVQISYLKKKKTVTAEEKAVLTGYFFCSSESNTFVLYCT